MHAALQPFIEPPRFRWRHVVAGVVGGLLASALVLRHVDEVERHHARTATADNVRSR